MYILARWPLINPILCLYDPYITPFQYTLTKLSGLSQELQIVVNLLAPQAI